MKKVNGFSLGAFIASAFICFGTLIFAGCQNDLISEPNMSQISSSKSPSTTTLMPPSNLKASQGGVRTVTLQWDEAIGATKYLIFAADTQFSEPYQIDETTASKTEIKTEQPSGSSKWYTVRSVRTINSKSEESVDSNKVFGSTLATPIITSITASEDGTSATITWWMENCNKKTYLDNVKYKISCYDSNKPDRHEISSISAEKDTDSVTFSGLKGKTTYFYQVEAYLVSAQSELEESTIESAETAHRQIPNAATNFTAEKGLKENSITLSWELPDLVDFHIANGGYESHPVYFTLERKLISENEKNYKKIATYIGSIIPENTNFEDSENQGKYYFSCTDENKNSSNIKIIAEKPENVTYNSYYENYIPTSSIIFEDKDTSISKNEQYSYRLISYVDDTSGKIISAKTAITETTGWLVAPVSIKANAEYIKDEEKNEFSEINVKFSINFDSREQDSSYTYILEEKRISLNNNTEEFQPKQTMFETLEKANNYVRNFNDLKNEEGYYEYSIYIVEKSSTGTENPITKSETRNKITITNDPLKKIEIKNFTIEDGYAHKFILKWEMNKEQISTCAYRIRYTENGITSEEQEINPNIDIENGCATYEDLNMESGINRIYTLIADNGFKDEKSSRSAYTLGTVKPIFNTTDYSTITVTWNKIQNGYYDEANTQELPIKYEVSAKYNDTTEELINTENENNDGFTKIEENSDNKTYTCIISKPKGWNNPKLSGNDITLSIKAISTERKETTEEIANTTANVTVYTLGPAKVNTKITYADSERINLTWDKVKGASKYLIYRAKYADNLATQFDENGQTYYILTETDNNNLKIEEKNGGNTEQTTKATSTSSTIEFSDIHQEIDTGESTYTKNQQQLGWGGAFGYVILPIKDDNDFSFKDKSSEVFYDEENPSDSSKVPYGIVTPTIGATYGYGINVTASKSESTETINISWTSPYSNTKTVPYIYRRKYGTSDWIEIGKVKNKETIFYDALQDEDKTKAYYYAVQYNTSDNKLNYIKSYDEALQKKDTRYKNSKGIEELNKGYLFYVDFSASYNGSFAEDGSYIKNNNYYSERVSHKLWDFDERAEGPDSYKINAWNVNNTQEKINIATISVDSENGTETFSINATNNVLDDTSNDTYIEQNGSDLILYPIQITKALTDSSIKTTDTDGIMRALRSTKTYYELETTRNYELNGTLGEVEFKNTTYGYRQLTDDELARCISLIIADGLYQAGIPAAEGIVTSAEVTTRKINGGEGTFEIFHTAWQKRFQWGFKGQYTHIYPNGCSSLYAEKYKTEFTLTSNMSANEVGSNKNKVYYMAPIDINIRHDSGIKDLNCTISFTAGTVGSTSADIGYTKLSYNLTISKNSSKLVSISNDKTNFLKYFPFALDTDCKNPDLTVNKELETYKNTSYTWWK